MNVVAPVQREYRESKRQASACNRFQVPPETSVSLGGALNEKSYIILPLTHFREMLWTRTPLNWREVEGCESHEWKEQHTRTCPNSSIRHQK